MAEYSFVYDDVRITPDRQIGLHSQSTWELSYVLCGAGMRTIGEHTEPFRAGEIVLVPPGIPHVWRFDPAETDDEGYIANISVFFAPMTVGSLVEVIPEIADVLTRLDCISGALRFTGHSRDRIARRLETMRGMSRARRAAQLPALLMDIAEAGEYSRAGEAVALTQAERRMEQIRIFCSCNYTGVITPGDVASHVGMNKSSFCTFIRRRTGMTLSEYVNGMRLEKAAEMLAVTDEKVAEIAYAVGFASVTYFNRLFRARFSVTPGEYRHNIDSEK